MASTTNRTVELQIKLAGVQSLEQLEQVTTEINDDLKQIPINSKAFTEMSALAKKANSQLKEVDASIEGITSTEKAESVLKMGEGIAGAFQIAGAASLVFGEQTQEQIQKVIVGVGSMVAAIDGARKLTEAFSAKNIAGLKSVVQGFKESAIGAKLFGASARTALISTGIGAFVVALGTVVAYWDEINAFFKNNAEKKALEENAKSREAELEVLKTIQNQYNQNLSVAEKQFEKDGDSQALQKARIEQLQISNEAIQKQIDLNNTNYRLANNQFNKDLENNKFKNESDKATAEYKLTALTNENALLEEQKKLNIDLIAQNDIKGIVSPELDNINKTIKARKDQLIILDSQQNKESQIYAANRKNLEDQISSYTKLTKYGYTLTIAEQDQLNTLNAQLQALNNKEQLRVKELNKRREANKLEIESLQHEASLNMQLTSIRINTTALLDLKQKELVANTKNAQVIDEQLQLIEQQKVSYQDFYDKKEKLFNFDVRGRELFAEQNRDVQDMLDGYDQLIGATKFILASNVENKDISDKVLTNQAIELTFFKEGQELQIKKLENSNAALEINQDNLVIQMQELENQKAINESELSRSLGLLNNLKLKDQSKLTDDERLELANKIADAESRVNEFTLAISENKSGIARLDNEINNTSTEILANNTQINAAVKSIAVETNKASAAVENQSRGYAKAQEFVSKYNAEIKAGQQLVNAAFDLQIAQLERKAELEKRNLEEIQAQKEEYAKIDEDLNAELADAQGERYDDLLEQIQANQQAMQVSADAELNSKRIIADAEWKAAKAKKTQSIIDATIQGALAVVEALPNVFLAVLVGALSAVQIGVIASQPVPEKPNFATGGVVKANGYPKTGDKVPVNVNPDEMILNNQQQARLFAIADGSPNINTNSGIDYRLIGIEVGNALAANPMYVSVTEFNAVQNRLKIVENRASLSK